MIVTIVDGNGQEQEVLWESIGSTTDNSGLATGVSEPLLAAPAVGAQRAGWLFQNLSTHLMYINDNGGAAVNGAGSFAIPAGGFFPPANYPVSQGQINVLGTLNDPFTVRQW